MILTASHISTTSVTDAQIGACHKVFGPDNKTFYMVASASDPDKEYKVTWSNARGSQCQCKAALYGNLCWHIRASIACEAEVSEALAEMASLCVPQAATTAVVTSVDIETLARVQAACEAPAKVSKAKATSKAFSMMR